MLAPFRIEYSVTMLLYRLGPEGFYAATDEEGTVRILLSDPFAVRPGGWKLGREVKQPLQGLLPPVLPGKIVGVGRNYVEHARELGNEPPREPVLFLKSPSSVVGPLAPVLLPPESERVEYEGEIGVILRERLQRADEDQARTAVLGVTCACDVTARDLQRRDATFARGKSFDTFCPLGPAVRVDPDLEELEVITRVDGEVRQHGAVRQMTWGILELLVYVSRFITLERGDLILTGSPPGVGPLADGSRLEVEIPGVGILENRVERRRLS
jgi:2-keto-4-pentenoate hydratase/2-oxohepta-3-ene-1,7-dioic acid hydratase in catechol pathway